MTFMACKLVILVEDFWCKIAWRGMVAGHKQALADFLSQALPAGVRVPRSKVEYLGKLSEFPRFFIPYFWKGRFS